MPRYFFDLIYTEPCRKGMDTIPFQCQARIYIIASDEEDARNRLGIFFNRPVSQFTYTMKKLEHDISPEILKTGESWYFGDEKNGRR